MTVSQMPKSLLKIQHIFTTQKSKRIHTESVYFNMVKVTSDQPPSSVTLNFEKLKAFFLKLGTK